MTSTCIYCFYSVRWVCMRIRVSRPANHVWTIYVSRSVDKVVLLHSSAMKPFATGGSLEPGWNPLKCYNITVTIIFAWPFARPCLYETSVIFHRNWISIFNVKNIAEICHWLIRVKYTQVLLTASVERLGKRSPIDTNGKVMLMPKSTRRSAR